LQPDSIIPNLYNPQNLNRYSYVRNNPIRYNDPTGHFCSDPEDLWSPGCDGSGNPPPVTAPPPPPAPVVIVNPDPLDDGQEQDDPTPSTSQSETTNCPSNLPNCDPLTPVQQFGWGITLILIDVAILAPIDLALASMSIDGALACLSGVALACLADIPLAALDYAAAEVTVSVNVYMATSIKNGYRSEFEWIIASSLFP